MGFFLVLSSYKILISECFNVKRPLHTNETQRNHTFSSVCVVKVLFTIYGNEIELKTKIAPYHHSGLILYLLKALVKAKLKINDLSLRMLLDSHLIHIFRKESFFDHILAVGESYCCVQSVAQSLPALLNIRFLLLLTFTTQ